MRRSLARFEIIGTRFNEEGEWIRKKRWYWRMISSNGKVLCQSKQYESIRAARQTVDIIRSTAADMGLVEIMEGDGMQSWR